MNIDSLKESVVLYFVFWYGYKMTTMAMSQNQHEVNLLASCQHQTPIYGLLEQKHFEDRVEELITWIANNGNREYTALMELQREFFHSKSDERELVQNGTSKDFPHYC